MLHIKIIIDPRYEVVFECPFDDLVEEIGREEFMNVRAREPMCERLMVIQFVVRIEMQD